mmetsp:Transcript_74959/g.171816  ORF Transcript_74959/g.171816 Transcript_74959/m.171816 type:complete len:452 (-) Transcript_74959:272-1627(-)
MFGPLSVLLVLGSWDPDTYEEPAEAAYWPGRGISGDPPSQIPVYTEMDRATFDRLFSEGKAFVITNFVDLVEWPMKGWTCDTFRQDQTFKGAKFNRMYPENDSPNNHVEISAASWGDAVKAAGSRDSSAPEFAPFYFGIKDLSYGDPLSKTWKKSMLTKIQNHTKVPTFMDPRNKKDFMGSPEFWFSSKNAGAKAHMDTHTQMTMSVQLSGRKRWRLGLIPPRTMPHLGLLFEDGSVYEHRRKVGKEWTPTYDFVLETGDALFVPPATVHETNNVGETGSCALSVTYQLSYPLPAKFYRAFWPRMRRTPDISEAWPLGRCWATLCTHKKFSGMAYSKAVAASAAVFRKFDKNSDGFLVASELKKVSDSQGAVAFHDTDGDSRISSQEFAEGYAFWFAVEQQVVAGTPSKLKKLHYKGLEDLPTKVADRVEDFTTVCLAKEYEEERNQIREV